MARTAESAGEPRRSSVSGSAVEAIRQGRHLRADYVQLWAEWRPASPLPSRHVQEALLGLPTRNSFGQSARLTMY
jgi:hypothetical protein